MYLILVKSDTQNNGVEATTRVCKNQNELRKEIEVSVEYFAHSEDEAKQLTRMIVTPGLNSDTIGMYDIESINSGDFENGTVTISSDMLNEYLVITWITLGDQVSLSL